MNSQTLPINLHPPIDAYLNHAYPLSILSTSEEYLPWFYSNYIQLYCPVDFPPGHFNFYMHSAYPALISPLLDTQWLDRNIVTCTSKSLSDFLISCVDGKNYIQLFLDEFYIPQRGGYRKYHFIHDLLIFGYDERDKTFDTLGYNDKGVYTTYKAHFDDIEQAFSSVEGLSEYQTHFFYSKIWLGKIMEGVEGYFDIQSVIEQLEDFLSANNTSNRFRLINTPQECGVYRIEEDAVYGIDTYKYLRRYLSLLLKNQCDFNPIYFHAFFQHKSCMATRIQFMEEHNFLATSFEFYKESKDIEEQAKNLRMMMLKFSIRRNNNIIERMLETFDALIERDIKLLTNVTSELCKSILFDKQIICLTES